MRTSTKECLDSIIVVGLMIAAAILAIITTTKKVSLIT